MIGRTSVAAVVMLTLIVLFGGCTPGAASAVSSATPTVALRATPSVSTCSEFTALSGTDQSAVADAHNNGVRLDAHYLPALTEYCLINPMSGIDEALTKSVAEQRARDAADQADQASQAAQDTAAQASAAASIASAAAAAASAADNPADGVVWTTESKLGYTSRMTLTLGPLMAGAAKSHPAASDFRVGTACSYDPTTDAAIPVTIIVTNTTPSSSSLPALTYILSESSGTSPTVSIDLEQEYSSGPDCTHMTVGYVYGNSAWQTPLSPHQSYRTASFIVIHNYFSPRYPAPGGASGDLALFSVAGSCRYAGGRGDCNGNAVSDPIINSTAGQQSISLNGQKR